MNYSEVYPTHTESEKEQAPTFTVNAVSNVPNSQLSYQWKMTNDGAKGAWIDIEGANQSSYTPEAHYSGSTKYKCFVTNTITFGETSLSFTADSEIVEYRVKPTYASGSYVTYLSADSVAAKNQANFQLNCTALTYDSDVRTSKIFQWYRNSTASNQGGEIIPGACAGTEEFGAGYCLLTVDTSQTGTFYYYCKITTILELENGELSWNYDTVSDPVRVDVVDMSDFFDGEGTETDPFLIKSVEELQTIVGTVARGNPMGGLYFKFVNDVTLPEDWEMIGRQIDENQYNTKRGTNVYPFSGTIDGDGHTLTIPEGGLPLFRYVRDAHISNLNIYGEKIAGAGLVNEYFVDYGTDGNYSRFCSH